MRKPMKPLDYSFSVFVALLPLHNWSECLWVTRSAPFAPGLPKVSWSLS